jgi:hypothetical protein
MVMGLRMILARSLSVGSIPIISTMLIAATIKYDEGGDIYERARQITMLKNSTEIVQIDGPCYSACTMYLSLAAEKRMCITRFAEFIFHDVTTAPRMQARAKQFLLSYYPDWVKLYILERGGLQRNWIYLRYKTAAKHLPICIEHDEQRR